MSLIELVGASDGTTPSPRPLLPNVIRGDVGPVKDAVRVLDNRLGHLSAATKHR